MQIAALTTCYNRQYLTEQSLNSLKNAVSNCSNIELDYYVVDDGSSDKTSEMIINKHPDVTLILGDGNLFWNRGMIRAWKEALRSEKNYDAFLLFNDDILFYEYCIKEMVSIFVEEKIKYDYPLAIVGPVLNPEKRITSYGGLIKNKKSINPLKFCLVKPKSEVTECDTLNMNCSLIDIKAVQKIGILDEFFHHANGDLDYGLRLKKSGGKILLVNKHLGECRRNLTENTWLDSSMGRVDRLKKMLNVKGMPINERKHYYKRHGGYLWPIFWIAPYLAILILNVKVAGERKIC